MTPRFPFRSPDDGASRHPHGAGADDAGSPPPRDELDGLLRDWHDHHRATAHASRDRLLEAVAADARMRPSFLPRWVRPLAIAASIGLAVTLALLVTTATERTAVAEGIVMVPEAGRLDAIAPDGALIGPCALAHTDVKADIAGPFSRVTVRQQYRNTYPVKIEAVYTFPLSHRGAVDRMTMTIVQADGERVVVGEVRERSIARAMYEAAREQGYVASLLEQERPNIFTQSIANIEPGARVDIEISYVETLVAKAGAYSFEFPTVVGPRYIPGDHASTPPPFPCRERLGVVLLAPASVVTFDGDRPAWAPTADALPTLLAGAYPMATPEQLAKRAAASTCGFTVTYGNQSRERCMLFDDGTGWVNGRWFWVAGIRPGAPFAQPTSVVPDADRITPMPVAPGTRAGHDLSISVSLDAGGVPITAVTSALHAIREDAAAGRNDPSRRSIALAAGREIPNRDFILGWRVKDHAILEGVVSHWSTRTAPMGIGSSFDASSVPAAVDGGYLTVVLAPPAVVAPAEVPARELVFVLDTSGSMSGFPIEKAKELMMKSIAAMRPTDTFNVITFAGDTHVLWPQPRPADEASIREAQAFVGGQRGGGGTEMMQAIDAALVQRTGPGLTPAALADLPADGRAVRLLVPYTALVQLNGRACIQATPQVAIPFTSPVELPSVLKPEGVTLSMEGAWSTVGGERVLQVREAAFAPSAPAAPMRLCIFLTDGFVGNDRGIVAAVRANAGTTRVFSLGIGNSVNRWLLDEMARAGRGECEIVTLEASADEAVARLTKRIATPVLADVSVSFEGITATAVTPSLLPDLFDAKPIVVHARYAQPGQGTIVLRGRTGAGPWERRVPVSLAGIGQPGNGSMLPSLWARSQVDDALAPVLKELEQDEVPAEVRRRVTSLGEGWQVMTPFTSFVAIEKARVTVGGKPMLVPVPIELPQGTRFDGFFGEWRGGAVARPDARKHRADAGAWDGSAGAAPVVSADIPNAGAEVAPSSEPLASRDRSGRAERRLDAIDAKAQGHGEAEQLVRRGGGMSGRPQGQVEPRQPSGVPLAGGSGGGGMVGGGFGAPSAPKVATAPSAATPGAPEAKEKRRASKESLAMRDARPETPAMKADGASAPATPEPRPLGGSSAPTEAALAREADAQAPAITTEQAIIMVHDMRDLVGVGADAGVVEAATARLMRELQKITGRELWTDQGGASAAWSAQDGLLQVEAWPSIQRTIGDALRVRRDRLATSGGVDRDLIPAEAVAAVTAMRTRLARPMTQAELERVWDLLGAGLFRLSIFGSPVPAGMTMAADGTIWVSIGVTEKMAVPALAARLIEPGINDAARVIVGRVQPGRLAELVLDPSVVSCMPVVAP